MKKLILSAPAKVNLFLHVTGRRDDGYHLLDSLVTFTDFGDELTFSPTDTLSFSCDGPYAQEIDSTKNHILTAMQLFSDHCKTPTDLSIHLKKNIPVGAGLGGGSADAAAALRGLAQFWNTAPPEKTLHEIALSIGADVPVCLTSRTSQMQGIGESLTPKQLPRLYLLLINTSDFIATKDIFANLELPHGRSVLEIPDLPTYDDAITFLNMQQNDLTKPASHLHPHITQALCALKDIDTCDLARMSGSGATCFGIFKTREHANAAMDLLRTQYPDWWMCVTRTLTSPSI